MSTAVFGRIAHAGLVEDAVRDTLQKWLSTFLSEAEDQWGLPKGTISRRWAWVRTIDPQSLGPAMVTTIAVQNVGAVGGVHENGDGSLDISEGINVAVFTKGRNRDESLDHARMLLIAVMACLRAQRSLGGFADTTRILDYGYDLVRGTQERTLAGAELVLRVDVSDVAGNSQGPDLPDPLPEPPDAGSYPDYPQYTADTVHVTVDVED
jgi:hypothetical protein